MIPSAGPTPQANAAVRALYDRLRLALPDRVRVVQDARWVGRSVPGEPLRDGRADFCLLDPERGVLLLDVVAGGLGHDPHSGRWTDADGPRLDPFARLEAAARGLGLLLGDLAAPTPITPLCGFALVLPDAFVGPRGLGAAAPAERVIDAAGLDRLGARVDALFTHFAARRGREVNASERWWWRAAEELFVAPRQVRARLRAQVEAVREEMVALSDEQLRVLELIARLRRVAVVGAAGTGKTLLAVERARMLARQGQDVLLTCYNKALGQAMRAAVADQPRITATHFHDLGWKLGGFERRGEQPPIGAAARSRFFDEAVPARLREAMRREGPCFDAVVVDEAQDFLPSWWEALDAACRDGARAIRILFFDPQQCLRDAPAEVPGADEALVLTTNWRNTGHIHRHLQALLPGLEGVRALASAGPPVLIEPERPDLGAALRRVLGRICGEGAVPPDDVVLLTGHNPARARALVLPQPIAGVRLTAGDEPGAVRVRSIQAFKGLEAPVVVLAELDDFPPGRRHALYYAGASRAQAQLVVLQSALLPEQLARGVTPP
jgi:hypothetical protein